jgi:glycosyltransferase involved in cell wall biosynthesis
LFLTNTYPDFESSYRGVFIRKMVTLLQEEGFQISVVTPKIYEGSRIFEERDGIKVYRFPFFAQNRLLIEYKKIPYLKMILYYVTGFFFTLYAILKNKCDLIHAHWAIPTGVIGLAVGALLRKPLVVTIHGSDLRMAMEKSNLLKDLFLQVCRRAGHIISVSEPLRREMEQVGIRSEKISMLPMGVDEVFLEVGGKRTRFLEKRSVTVMNNRNLLPIYNVSSFVRAIPMVLQEEPAVKFLIAGEGAEKENLEMEVENLGIGWAVQFLGRIPHEEMATLLSQADIYVSTSLHDGTSVSLLEAMACGTFPIVTDIAANREWIKDGENGFLVPADQDSFLAKMILQAIRSQPLLNDSCQKNLSIVKERAHWSVHIGGVKEIYARILSR